MATMRLQVFLSQSGVASRRASSEIIKAARVKVNGKVITSPGYRVDREDSVTLDNFIIRPEEEKIYLMLNKPVMCISSSNDPEKRMTVMDLVENSLPQRLFPVGRLDYLTSGLLFITNDGDFAHKLSHPRSGYLRKYEVTSKVAIPRKMLENWRNGIEVDGVRYRLQHFDFQGQRSVVLSLTEGKNREIRNVFDYYNIPITSLHRNQFGPQRIGNLKAGKFRFLSTREVSNLLENNSGQL